MRKIIIGMVVASTLMYADFSRSNDGIVTDSKTGLQWQDDYSDNDGSIPRLAWSSAIKYCNELSLGDNNDWRLPNINELKSIIKDRIVAPMIDDAFDNTNTSAYFWSSTTGANSTSYAWYVYFDYGYSDYYDKSANNDVRCVRSGQ